jgi:hypothetical protein
MEVKELEYNGTKLLSAEVFPSQYLFSPDDAAKIVSWQIIMADNSTRDILSSATQPEDNMANMGSQIFFNAKSMPISGFENFNVERLKFKHLGCEDGKLVFVPECQEELPFMPRTAYRLSELYFRMEISMTNNGTMPIYWRPSLHFFITLPWAVGIPLEKHIVRVLAKKRLRISEDLRVISSAKSSEKTSLESLNDGPIGFTQLLDSKIWIGTSNEEEGLSFIFGTKTRQSTIMMRKTKTPGQIEVDFVSDIPPESNNSLSHDEMQNHTIIPPGGSDTFAAEISTY